MPKLPETKALWVPIDSSRLFQELATYPRNPRSRSSAGICMQKPPSMIRRQRCPSLLVSDSKTGDGAKLNAAEDPGEFDLI